MFGLNIDPNNPRGNPDPAELQELGVEMVRYTFYDSSGGDQIDPAKANFYRDKARAYRDAGIDSLVILTYDTYPSRPSPDAPDRDWDSYLERFARRAGQIAQLLAPWQPAYQVWNEPDHPPKGNYVPTVREAVFGRMLRRTRDAIKTVDSRAPVVTAGLAMGDPGWLTRVITSQGGELPADIVAFHPYGQRPEPNWPRANWGFGYVGDLLNNYYRAGQRKPIWITEMGIKIDEIDNNPDQAAEFLSRYYRTVTTSLSDKVQKLLWFCYSDGMVNPFGLVDSNGSRKPAYFAFLRAARSRPTEPALPSIGTTPPPPLRPEPTLTAPPPPSMSPPPAVEIPAVSVPPASGQSPDLSQLANQLAGLANQIQQLQDRMAQFQGQLQDLSGRQTQLQALVRQWQPQPQPGPGVSPTIPPVPVPAAPTAPVVFPLPAPAPVGKPAPPIQNIIQLLSRDPAQQFGTRPLNQIQRIVIHHTAIPANIGADRIASYGVQKKGWPAIKYHYFISGEALIQQTNELTSDTTHAGPYSSISIGIGFAGDFTGTMPTQAQIDAGARLIAWLLPQFGLSVQDVVGYKELINTQSPGVQWDSGLSWGDRLREQIRTYL